MGTLYIVPTPIGNLEDITLRALRVLKEVTLIAAEDTRTSRVLLNHYEIATPMTSYHEHSKLTKLDEILEVLANGNVALISDAGTPGVSDPGYELISAAIEAAFPVVPLPGANAVITALVGSGFPSDSFVYVGFLPKKDTARRDLLTELRQEQRTIIAYENPYRVGETLATVSEVMGPERMVCVAREISKMFEEFYRDTAENAANRYMDEAPKGEVTLVIAGVNDEMTIWNEHHVTHELMKLLDKGEKLSKAAKQIAKQSGWNKRDVYALGLAERE